MSASKFGALGRRQFASMSAGTIAVGLAPMTAWGHGSHRFSLGVASGDPTSFGITLWTRLAPDPLVPGGGMPPVPKWVRFEVATDPKMRHVVRRGHTCALPQLGHNVRVRVGGLRPDRWYWYRFVADGEDSPIGRTRTFPGWRSDAQRMRFGLASCQDYQNGFFSAYHNLACEDLDFIVHVGDYIYEGGPRTGAPRQVNAPEIVSLEDYRIRYALYRLDPALQAAHAACPWILTWDDHEVDNNYAGRIPEDDQDPEVFASRRAAAYRAYAEAMPLAPWVVGAGDDLRLNRRFDFGKLASFHVLDTRQFRDDQACGDGIQPACPEVFDPERSMIGGSQSAWLERSLGATHSTWNVLAQQVMFTHWDLRVLGEGLDVPFLNMDAWDGYPASRAEVVAALVRTGARNPIVLTGDIHSSWVADIHEQPGIPDSAIVASEFVGTSITSDFPLDYIPLVQATLPDNPHIRYFDGAHRGYVTFDVDENRWSTRFHAVDSILDPLAPARVTASFVVEEGVSGASVA